MLNKFIIKRTIKDRERSLSENISLDIAFPDRKNSKTEELKAEIMDLERQLVLLKQGLEDQSYEDYTEEFMTRYGHTGLTGAIGIPGSSSKSKEDEIAELEAQLAALRGGKDE